MESLVKSFGETRAVAGIDLAVTTGTVYGVLGPNGAGKTTTIRMLATLLHPDAGWARVLGHDVVAEADAVRASVSLTGQFASVDEELTGCENLVLIGRLLGLSRSAARERAVELLDAFGAGRLGQPLGPRVLGGHAAPARHRRQHHRDTRDAVPRRAHHRAGPPEPQPGVGVVRVLVGEGTTVLLTTQYLEEADQLADRIAIIDRGKVIAEGTSGQLKAKVGSGTLHVRLSDPHDRERAARVLSDVLGETVKHEPDPASLSARTSDAEKVGLAIAELARTGIGVAEVAVGQPSLDEVFLALTGHPAETPESEEDAA